VIRKIFRGYLTNGQVVGIKKKEGEIGRRGVGGESQRAHWLRRALRQLADRFPAACRGVSEHKIKNSMGSNPPLADSLLAARIFNLKFCVSMCFPCLRGIINRLTTNDARHRGKNMCFNPFTSIFYFTTTFLFARYLSILRLIRYIPFGCPLRST
jgi:hypothetical protein